MHYLWLISLIVASSCATAPSYEETAKEVRKQPLKVSYDEIISHFEKCKKKECLEENREVVFSKINLRYGISGVQTAKDYFNVNKNKLRKESYEQVKSEGITEKNPIFDYYFDSINYQDIVRGIWLIEIYEHKYQQYLAEKSKWDRIGQMLQNTQTNERLNSLENPSSNRVPLNGNGVRVQ